MTQTIAQQINWDFEVNGKLEIKDKNGNLIYYEFSDGYWKKRKYDSKCNLIYLEDSDGYWAKREYDSQDILIYYADSEGDVQDNRPKPYEGKIVEIEGI
jgi:hypothetical protein